MIAVLSDLQHTATQKMTTSRLWPQQRSRTHPAMGKPEDVEWIRRGLMRAGKNQSDLARALGRDRAVISRILKGERPLKFAEVKRIENFLGVTRTGDALFERTAVYDEAAAEPQQNATLGKLYAMTPADAGFWEIDFDAEPADLALRPSGQAAVRGLFGVIVNDPDMAPRFKSGETAWINPNRAARAGDDALFAERGDSFGPQRVRLGELQRETRDAYIACNYAGEEFTLPKTEWRALQVAPRD